MDEAGLVFGSEFGLDVIGMWTGIRPGNWAGDWVLIPVGNWVDMIWRRWYPTPGPVAQLVEQRTFNPTVRGSSPRGLTNLLNKNS
jgi:hypothetical protein